MGRGLCRLTCDYKLHYSGETGLSADEMQADPTIREWII